MNYIELENKLKKRIRNRRITEMVLSVVFLIIAIVFTVLRDGSRTVEVIGKPPFVYESVSYNNDYVFGMAAGYLGLMWCVIFLIIDLLFVKLETVGVGSDHITFYKGVLRPSLYVNGSNEGLSWGSHYLEIPLSDGTRVTASLGKWSVHLTFSNGRPPIDL